MRMMNQIKFNEISVPITIFLPIEKYFSLLYLNKKVQKYCINLKTNRMKKSFFPLITMFLKPRVMNYKHVMLISIPIYFVAAALVITVTQFESFNRIAVTCVFGSAALVSVIVIAFQIHNCPELYEFVEYYEGTDWDNEDETRNRMTTKEDTITNKKIQRSREIATLIGLILPILLCSLTVFIATFTETLNSRYYEYVSVYINYSVPFYVSLLLMHFR